MGVTRGQLPQRAGSLGLNSGGAAATVPPATQEFTSQWPESWRSFLYCFLSSIFDHTTVSCTESMKKAKFQPLPCNIKRYQFHQADVMVTTKAAKLILVLYSSLAITDSHYFQNYNTAVD